MDAERRHPVEVAPGHPAFAGHFPGRPMLPGVALVAEAMEGAADDATMLRAIGPRPVLSVVKFLHPVRPGDRLEIAWSLEARAVAFEVLVGGRVAASGRFARADLAQGAAP